MPYILGCLVLFVVMTPGHTGVMGAGSEWRMGEGGQILSSWQGVAILTPYTGATAWKVYQVLQGD